MTPPGAEPVYGVEIDGTSYDVYDICMDGETFLASDGKHWMVLTFGEGQLETTALGSARYFRELECPCGCAPTEPCRFRAAVHQYLIEQSDD